MVAFAILLLLILFAVYYKKYTYWSSRGVHQHSPWTQFKLDLRSIFQSVSAPEAFRQNYASFPGFRYAGIYIFGRPRLLIRDPDLIKQIALKHFECFVDRGQVFRTRNEPFWERTLLALKGEDWRDMRNALSPLFTANSLKSMFGLVEECAQRFVEHFETQPPSPTVMEVDVKDAFARFANDAIASTAFGVTCDSLSAPNNQFYLAGRRAAKFAGPKFLLFLAAPRLVQLLGLRFVDAEVEEFFGRTFRESAEGRRASGLARPDLIDMVLKPRQNGAQLGVDDLASQAFVFYLAGFDTLSTSMSFLAFELALNPDVQGQLRQEIDRVLLEHRGNISYETLSGAKYLNMVMSESLRKWPATAAANRTCTKPFTVERGALNEEKPVRFEKGDVVILPYYGIHRDPNYFPDPDRFDPERFSEENAARMEPHAYLPFGLGPRGCLGNRLAVLEMKLLFFRLLSKFELVVVERTRIPPKLGKNRFSLSLAKGLWLGFKSRK